MSPFADDFPAQVDQRREGLEFLADDRNLRGVGCDDFGGDLFSKRSEGSQLPCGT